jgi:hypothetical protein
MASSANRQIMLAFLDNLPSLPSYPLVTFSPANARVLVDFVDNF